MIWLVTPAAGKGESGGCTCGEGLQHTGLHKIPPHLPHQSYAHQRPCPSMHAVHVVRQPRHVTVLVEPVLRHVVRVVVVGAQQLGRAGTALDGFVGRDGSFRGGYIG